MPPPHHFWGQIQIHSDSRLSVFPSLTVSLPSLPFLFLVNPYSSFKTQLKTHCFWKNSLDSSTQVGVTAPTFILPFSFRRTSIDVGICQILLSVVLTVVHAALTLLPNSSSCSGWTDSSPTSGWACDLCAGNQSDTPFLRGYRDSLGVIIWPKANEAEPRDCWWNGLDTCIYFLQNLELGDKAWCHQATQWRGTSWEWIQHGREWRTRGAGEGKENKETGSQWQWTSLWIKPYLN